MSETFASESPMDPKPEVQKDDGYEFQTIEVGKPEEEKKREWDRFLARSRRIDPTDLVDPDPAFRYRGFNKDHRAITRAKEKGFEIVPAKYHPTERYKTRWKHGTVDPITGGHLLGDLVLMREPRGLYELKVEENRDRFVRKAEAYNEQAKDNINRIARDSRISGPHQDIAFDDSKEGPAEFYRGA